MSTSTAPSAAGTSSQRDAALTSRVVVPSDALILPLTAGTLGIMIGMYRGGRRARLRFLAENAHRKPTTSRGWYFYMKTRNYKIAYEASRTGARTALALGGAVGTYVLLEEGVSYLREKHLDIVTPRGDGEGFRDRTTWRRGGEVWWDGVVAGGLLGLGVGVLWRLPTRLTTRCMFWGTVLGGAHTTGKAMMISVAEQIKEDQKAKEQAKRVAGSADISTPPAVISSISHQLGSRLVGQPSDGSGGSSEILPAEQHASREQEHFLVDRHVHPGDTALGFDEVVSDKEQRGWWSTARGWFGR